MIYMFFIIQKKNMKLENKTKIKNLFKNWIFWLIIVTGIAIIIRSIPAWINVAWGGDLGIYFGLTKDCNSNIVQKIGS